MPDPSFVRREVAAMLPIWQQIRDCIEGETAVKGVFHPGYIPSENMGGVAFNSSTAVSFGNVRSYLPMPNPEDESEDNIKRYRAYVGRAQFYPVTSRTIDGLSGQIFTRTPEINIPDAMRVMENDVDGTGLTIDQFAEKVVSSVLAYGRYGLLVDYPITDKPATKQQLKDGDIRPVIVAYDAWNIVNWNVIQRGARRVFNLIVLRENMYQTGDDGFASVESTQYRVLRLDPVSGNYTVEIWNKDDANSSGDTVVYSLNSGPKTVKDSNGKPLKDIPFRFVGAASNDWFIDKPPMADIASLNIGHYRNSADYEESCFISGQPTPVITGLEQSWVDKNFPDKKLMLGSRKAILLGKDAKAELLQAAENSMPMEAMKHKEEQMMAIGARLITFNKTTRTATETTVQQASENSTLGTIAANSGSAIEDCLYIAAGFMGVAADPMADDRVISVGLNDDFDMNKKTPQEINQIVLNWQAGSTSWTEMRVGLRSAGYTSQDDKTAMEEIQKEKQAAFALGGHPIADPFGLPPGITAPPPLTPATDPTNPLHPNNNPPPPVPGAVPKPKPTRKKKGTIQK